MSFATVGRNALNGHSWEKTAGSHAGRRHRVITYDWRGFGARADRPWDMNSTRWPPIFMFCSAGSACAGWYWPVRS